MSRPADLVQGTLDVLILRIVASDALHGLAISEQLSQRSGEALQVSRGSLYPALHKLEHEGLLRSEWRQSERGRRAKYYALTSAGRRRLAVETADWERLSVAISAVLKPA
jgi:PadR family transcriptional regulator PadR